MSSKKKIISSGDSSQLERLLSKNKSKSKKQLLFIAIEENQVKCCEILLENGFDPNSQIKKTGNTGLHEAAIRGFKEIVKLLLKYNINWRLKNNKGRNALHIAMIYGKGEIIDIMIENGVLLESSTLNSENILHFAPSSPISMEWMYKFFKETKNSSLEYLLTKHTNDKENTPLHLACEYGSKEIIKLYIDNGADVRVVTKDGKNTISILLQRIEREKLNSNNPQLYKEAFNSLKYLSRDYFTQTQIARALRTKLPAIDFRDCELNDSTFTYRILQMFELKTSSQLRIDNKFSSIKTGVTTYLTYLDVSYNNLTFLPKDLQQIYNLQWLNASNNKLLSLPLNLGLFNNLKYLDITNNQITSLPLSFAEFRDHKTKEIKLSELHLTGNDITIPPKRIIKQGISAIIDYFADVLEGEDETCKAISIICLGAPFTGKSSLLRNFNATKRGRTNFLARLASKQNIQRVETNNPPVDTISFQIKGSVTRAITDVGNDPLYLVKKALEEININIANKLEVFWKNFKETGSFYESKSYDTRYFYGCEFIDSFIEYFKSENLSREDVINIGNIFLSSGVIRIHNKHSVLLIDNNKEQYIIATEENSDIIIDYQALDFDKDIINSPIPWLFLNSCSIFIITWNIKKTPAQSGVRHWLDLIANTCTNENIAIILVATRSDEVSVIMGTQFLNVMKNTFCPLYPQIKCITAISNTTRDGIQVLKDTLFNITTNILKNYGKIPAKYTALRDALISESKRDVPVIFLDEYLQIASLFSLHDKQLYDATQFVRSTGVIYYQSKDLSITDTNEIKFKSIFCLSPSWLTHIVMLLFNAPSNQTIGGIITDEYIEKIWNVNGIPSYLYQPLIDILTSAELLFPIPESFKSSILQTKDDVIKKLREWNKTQKNKSKQPKLFRRSSGSVNIFVGVKQLYPKFLIPHLIPLEYSQEIYSTVWPERCFSGLPTYLEYSRIWKFKVVKDMLWNRLFKEVLLMAEYVPLYWNKGIIMYKGYSKVCLQRFTGQKYIILRVRSPITFGGSQLYDTFTSIINMVTSLTQYWFSDTKSVEISAPCTHCLTYYARENVDNLYPPFHKLHAFSIEDCTTAVSNHEGFMVCPRVYLRDLRINTPKSSRDISPLRKEILRGESKSEKKKIVKKTSSLKFEGDKEEDNINFLCSTPVKKVPSPVTTSLSSQNVLKSMSPLRRKRLSTSDKTSSLKSMTNELPLKIPHSSPPKQRSRRNSFMTPPISSALSLSPRKDRQARTSSPTLDIEVLRTDIEYELATEENKMFHSRVRVDQLVPDIVMVDLSNVKADPDDIILNDKLGVGAFGEVYKCLYKTEEYAVKILQKIDKESFKEFTSEVALMAKLKHPNLVNLKCFCTNPFMIVMELVSCGELYTFLHSENIKKRLNWRLRTRIAIDISRGMSFLHSLKPPIVHRDLKSPNILLVSKDIPNPDNLEEPIAKISDFGLSIHLFNSKLKQSTSERDVQTPTWLAPEVLKAKPYGERSDCYAMGIVMWELLQPNSHPFDEYNFGSFTSKLEEAIIDGKRPSIPKKYHKYNKYYYSDLNEHIKDIPKGLNHKEAMKIEYLRLMTSLWHQKPSKRVTFLQCTFKLTKRYKLCYLENK